MSEGASSENISRLLGSDDAEEVLSGLSLAKGAGVDESLLGRLLYLSLCGAGDEIRSSAESLFERHAPDEMLGLANVLQRSPVYISEHLSNLSASARDLVVEIFVQGLENTQDDTLVAKFIEVLGVSDDSRAVEPLIGAWDAWYGARPAIARAFCNLGDTRAIESLKEAIVGLEYPDEDAIKAIGTIGDARAIDALISAMGADLSPHTCSLAYEEIVSFGGVAVEPLIADLIDKGDWYLPDVDNATALGEIGDSRAIVSLIHAAYAQALDTDPVCGESIREREILSAIVAIVEQNSPNDLMTGRDDAKELLVALLGNENEDVGVRYRAATVLGLLGDNRAVEPLIAALDDQDIPIPQGAAEALGELGDARAKEPLKNVLEDENDSFSSIVREEAASALEQLNDLSHHDDPEDREKAEDLREIDNAAIASLISALGHQDGDVRKDAIEILADIGDPSATEPLIKILQEEGNDARDQAIIALGKIGDLRAVETLIRELSNEHHLGSRQWAAEALGEIGDARAIDPLINALGDSTYDDLYGPIATADWAARALVKIGRTAIAPLVKALDNRNGYVSRHATESLIEIGKGTVEPLISALDHPSSGVRWRAAKILGSIGDGRALEPLIDKLRDEDWQVRLYATEALGQLGDLRAVDPLIVCLDDDDWWVRRNAVSVLGKLGDRRAIEPLCEVLSDKQREVQEVAVRILGEFGDSRAVGPLTELLDDDEPYTLESGSTFHTLNDKTSEALKRLGHDTGR